MRFAVGDIHGFRFEMHDALRAAGLVDRAGSWAGGDSEVWFAGDLLDRGPDGVGVIADVRRWQREADEAGGSVRSVLGNHEVLALGIRRFGDRLVSDGDSLDVPKSFALSWMVNGGQPRDQDAMPDDAAEWLAELPAVVVRGDDLILHADTLEYLAFGTDPAAATATIADILHSDDLEAWWDLWRAMTTRYAFLGSEGTGRADAMLRWSGCTRIVHGHSLVSDLRHLDATAVEAPWSYAGGRALAVDGGIYAGGPCLVVPLDAPS
jgi:hypothetical protein